MLYGDHELVHRFLGPENIKPKSKTTSSESKDTQKSGKRKLPVGLCWKWNFGRKCQKENCSLKHLCTECYGNHRSLECLKSEQKTSQPPSSSFSQSQR